MKKISLLLLTFVFMFTIPVFASANTILPGVTSWSQINADSLQSIPSYPPNYNNYVITFYNAGTSSKHWNIYFINDITKIRITTDIDGKQVFEFLEGNLISTYDCYARYDSVTEQFYLTDWRCINSDVVLQNKIRGNCSALSWYNFDLYTSFGNLYDTANPFPAPPPVMAELVGASLLKVTDLAGGTVAQVLPLGLMVLTIILVLSLVVWLLRLWLLRRR